MPNNPFKNNVESSFEEDVSIAKPAAKPLSDQAKQQAQNAAKAVTNDIVAQLYGVTDKSTGDPQDPKDPNIAKAQKSVAPPLAKSKAHILAGTSNVGDHAKFIARQHYLDKGDAKGAENAMFHLQHYFDENVMTLEDRVKKFRREQEQQREERKKQQEEEEEEKKQAEAKEKEEPPQATGKGRNKMGTPPGKKRKADMGLKMGQMKTETFRGSSG